MDKGWISVNNRLPEHEQWVVCADKQGKFRKSVFHAKDSFPFRAGFSTVDYGNSPNIYHIPFVTHWQPIILPSEKERMAVLSNWTDNQRLINGDVIIEQKSE